MSKLNGKTALVTGGGSGIGLAIAKGFLHEGARVAITGRTLAKLQECSRNLAGGDRLYFEAADVSEPEQVRLLVEHVTQRFGPVDILVNNAGTNIKERTMRELTPQRWQKIVRTNLDGAFYCIHYVLPSMLGRHDGVIINVSSVAGKRANPLGGIAYAAAKFGMAALGLGLAAEEKDSGIRVCNIYPGEVDTPLMDARPLQITPEHRRRILQPEDVAAAVLFVATLPPRASVPELIIKPASQLYI